MLACDVSPVAMLLTDFEDKIQSHPIGTKGSAIGTVSNTQTCLGMQIGRTDSVKVISRSRIAIAKSCDS